MLFRRRYLCWRAGPRAEGSGRLEDCVGWRCFHNNEPAKVPLAFCIVIEGQLVCDEVQNSSLACTQIFRKDHVVLCGIASEHKQAIIKGQRLSVIQVQLIQGS